MRQSRFFYRDLDSPVPNRPLNVGVVAIIAGDGAIVLEERSDSVRWSLIGGGLEMTESPAPTRHGSWLTLTGM